MNTLTKYQKRQQSHEKAVEQAWRNLVNGNISLAREQLWSGCSSNGKYAVERVAAIMQYHCHTENGLKATEQMINLMLERPLNNPLYR